MCVGDIESALVRLRVHVSVCDLCPFVSVCVCVCFCVFV